MSEEYRDLVRLTNAESQMEAGALHGYLEQHGIFCYVQGQQHSAIFGSANVVAVDLTLMVAREDLEQAQELVVAFRDAEPIFDDDDSEAPDEPIESLEPMRRAYSRRKATILAFFPSFGCSHLYTGAWGRALILAVTQFAGMTAWAANPAFALLVPLAVVTDLVGGSARVRALQEPAPVPRAQVVVRDHDHD